MSDIATRPWIADGRSVGHSEHTDTDGESLGLCEIGRFYDAVNAAHAVACVNAINAAGITPAALAADPECLRRLIATLSVIDRVFLPRNPNKMRVAAPEVVAAVKEFRAALRACGIEVGP